MRIRVSEPFRVASHDLQSPPEIVPCVDQLLNSSDIHFNNPVFCTAIVSSIPLIPFTFLPTDTFYLPNAVDIHANGDRHKTQILSKSGPCSALLREGKKSREGNGQNRRL